MVAERRLCLVTGASAGIGAAFARLYAARGYDLALVARRADRLEALAREVADSCGARAFAIPADLSDPAAPAAIMEELDRRDRTVSALVNNAGYGLTGAFAVTPWEVQAAQIQVMLTAVCELTHRALPAMTGQGFGRVVNVASVAGLLPGTVGDTLYGPIKSFLIKFSQGLHAELRGSGVHVTALCPGYTYSEFHDVNHSRGQLSRSTPKWAWLTAEKVVRAGYDAVEANRAVSVPGAGYKAVSAAARLMPDSWMMRSSGRYRRR
ncbi:MAG TPA: SDR family oxidoreductase [Caulobacteraceae bacterium]|jgi:hypothetical protein